jgi:site-specific recombinase XerD
MQPGQAKMLSTMLGHSDTRTTEIYLHDTAEQSERLALVNRIAPLFGGENRGETAG